MRKSTERLAIGIATLVACFAIIILDSRGWLDVSKFGYAGLGAWITLVVQFYFRKKPSDEQDVNSSV